MKFMFGRQALKQYVKIPLTDTRWDDVLDYIRRKVSTDVRQITGRVFEKVERVEFMRTYDQAFGDPVPQWVLPRAFPIDTTETIELVFARFDDHDTNGVTLTQAVGSTSGDWKLQYNDHEEAYALRVQRASSFPETFAVGMMTGSTLWDSPTGFRLTYTGGYVDSGASTIPGDPFYDGEADVLTLPDEMRDVLLTKAAGDFYRLKEMQNETNFQAGRITLLGLMRNENGTFPLPWTGPQKRMLDPWKRADLDWVR